MTLKTLKAQALTDMAVMFDTKLPNVENATFTPLVGLPISCTVIKRLEGDYLPDGYEARIADQIVTIKYQLSEIYRDVLTGEIFTIGGEDYEVVSMSDERSDYWRKAIMK